MTVELVRRPDRKEIVPLELRASTRWPSVTLETSSFVRWVGTKVGVSVIWDELIVPLRTW